MLVVLSESFGQRSEVLGTSLEDAGPPGSGIVAPGKCLLCAETRTYGSLFPVEGSRALSAQARDARDLFVACGSVGLRKRGKQRPSPRARRLPPADAGAGQHSGRGR